LRTQRGEYSADHYVVCAGAWSARVLRRAAGWIPIEPGRGNSLTFDDAPVVPRLPLLFAEQHVVATPMDTRLRMTTGLELGGFPPSPSDRFLKVIRRAASEGLPSSSAWGGRDAWAGLRPMTPDGLPIIGPLRRLPNLHLASGHGTLGVVLAAVTGKVVAEMVQRGAVPGAIEPLLPSRFGE
ncbi:MAG: FAD-binding oxidoreductase, partial [Anaerolineales bacterium]